MDHTKCHIRALVLLAIAMLSLVAHAQPETIPAAIAKGAVGSVSTVPSGPTPTVAALLRTTDTVVIGTLGEPRSYLFDDQREVFTDYPLTDPTFIFQAHMMGASTPGRMPTVTVTQRGGTLIVNGTKFTQSEPALPPLQSGNRALFLLERAGDKYLIAGNFYGVFEIIDEKLMPLAARTDFAEEFKNITVAAAVDSIMTTLRARPVLEK
jgi:hypothetical protein